MEVSKRPVCMDSELEKAEENVVRGFTALSEFDGCPPKNLDDTCNRGRKFGYEAYRDGIPKATEIVEISNFIQWVGIQKNR